MIFQGLFRSCLGSTALLPHHCTYENELELMKMIHSLRRCRGLLGDADEREAGAAVDVVLLVCQDEGLGRHHLQVRPPRLDPRCRVHLMGWQGNYYTECLLFYALNKNI